MVDVAPSRSSSMALESSNLPLSRKRKRSKANLDDVSIDRRFTSRESMRDFLFAEMRSASVAAMSDMPQDEQHQNATEVDSVDRARASQSPIQSRSASSAPSDPKVNGEDAAAPLAASTDATPLPTTPGSPTTTESSLPHDTPAKPDAHPPITVVGDADDLPDVAPAVIEPDEPDEVEAEIEVEVEARSEDEDEARPLGRRRWAGRRRAAHANPQIEAAMRRQLELKAAYRAIARATKPCLAELARRTVDSLELDPQLHEKATEHEKVQAGLRARLLDRQAQSEKHMELTTAQLTYTFEAESAATRARYRSGIEEAKDRLLDKLRSEMLRIARQARLAKSEVAGNQTEDEDGILPSLKHITKKFKARSALGPAYESRSRVSIETRRETDLLGKRLAMGELLKTTSFETTDDFTVMDPAVRNAALAKRESTVSTDTLAQAAKRVEKKAKRTRPPPPPRHIPNHEAHGLMALADMALPVLPVPLGGPAMSSAEHGKPMGPPSTPSRRPSMGGESRISDQVPAHHRSASPKLTHQPFPYQPQDRRNPGRDDPSTASPKKQKLGRSQPNTIIGSPKEESHALPGMARLDRITAPDIGASMKHEYTRDGVAAASNPQFLQQMGVLDSRFAPARPREVAKPLHAHTASPSGRDILNHRHSVSEYSFAEDLPHGEPKPERPRIAETWKPSKEGRGGLTRKEAKRRGSKTAKDEVHDVKHERKESSRHRRKSRETDFHAPQQPGVAPGIARHSRSSSFSHEHPFLPPQYGIPVVQHPAPPDFDASRFRPMYEYNPRMYAEAPPFTPTADPVNHFGQHGIHRNSYPSAPPPPAASWSPPPPSPLVGLPHPGQQQMHPPFFFAGPPAPPQPQPQAFGHYGPQLPPMQPAAPLPSQPGQQQQMPTKQYGGQAIAPAGSHFGFVSNPPPAFAQQLDRLDHQQNSRRRHTDGSFPPFRPYIGPK